MHPTPPIATTSAVDLVVTDLDGTLWDRSETVHAQTLAALADLSARGLPVLVATGRRLMGALRVLNRYELTLPLVALDGAFGTDVEDGVPGRRWHHAPFAPAEAVAVLGAFRAAGLSPAAFVDRPGVEVVVEEQTSTSETHLRYVGDFLDRDDLDRVVATEPTYGFTILGVERAPLDAVVATLDDAASAYLSEDGFYRDASLSVRPGHTSKWEGVRAFCADRDLDCDRVLAIGDGPNDVELLSGAAIACAVAGGCDDVLGLADHVIDPPDVGGWARVLDLVGSS